MVASVAAVADPAVEKFARIRERMKTAVTVAEKFVEAVKMSAFAERSCGQPVAAKQIDASDPAPADWTDVAKAMVLADYSNRGTMIADRALVEVAANRAAAHEVGSVE